MYVLHPPPCTDRYGLAMISVVLLPTAMFTASPLWCNPCLEKDLCGGHEIRTQNMSDDRWEALGKGAWWVNKYCLMNQVFLTLYKSALVNRFCL